MREIKFRAWYLKNKKMYRNEWITVSGGGAWYIADPEQTDIRFRSGELNDATGVLMQYTGLKDKNGKEIYEGDIVSIENWSNPGQIKWSKDDACFCLVTLTGKWFSIDAWGEKEVIGNIYENPELLKEK